METAGTFVYQQQIWLFFFIKWIRKTSTDVSVFCDKLFFSMISFYIRTFVIWYNMCFTFSVIYILDHVYTVVLNLVGGTEPHKFHTCIHWTLRSWKNKMCVVNFIYFIFIAQNISLPSPWNWLTKPLGFDRTQVRFTKNHWPNINCNAKRSPSPASVLIIARLERIASAFWNAHASYTRS